ncbi:MAG: serine/threonine-protein kinase [Kofleriaceae bacterium]
MSDSPASEEFGPFRVYERLGIGGVATVHRAVHRGVEGFRKAVALKRLLPHLVQTPSIVEAFVREAQLASNMQHDNIAQTYELGKVGKTYFISMEFVPGPTLEQIMKHSQAVAGAIPVPVTLGIVMQLCEALDYAHKLADPSGKLLGIIHRDVSPPNVIVSNTGVVKLLDFGIAKVQNDTNPNVTGANVVKGKFNYIAPEYLQGQLDHRADLFAIGVIAHELLTGRRLFDGDNDFETWTKVLTQPIQPPSRWTTQIPPDLDHIVLTALQRDPAERWQAAGAITTAIANAARGPGAIATHAEILDWVHWAFTQKTPLDSQPVSKVIDTLAEPSTAETVLSPRQRLELDAASPPAELNEFSVPENTIQGIAVDSELMRSGQHEKLNRVSPTGLAELAAGYRESKPMIVAARPLRTKSNMPLGARTPAAGEPILDELADDESGVVVMPAAPPRRSHVMLYLFIVLLAAGGGVLAAAYFLEIDLPFLS